MVHLNVVKSAKWPQRLAACLAAVTTLCAGTMEGWTSPALPYLQQNDTDVQFNNTVSMHITDEQGSWIGSLGALGALFGSLPAGILADILGRRTVLLGLTVPFLLGWGIIILADKSVLMLYSARFILGLAAGGATVAVPLYTEEISETSIRGELGSYLDLAIAIGILYVFAFGAFVPYIWLCVSSVVVPALFAATFFWMPETPMYLLLKGKRIEAEKSLRWLRNVGRLDSPNIDMELREMEECLKKSSSCEQCNDSKFFSNLSISSPVCKSLAMVLGLMIFQQLSGINAIVFYTVDIFDAAGSTLSPYYCTLIVGVVQVISTYVAVLLMDRLGRRFLLVASVLGMAISLFILAGFSLYKDLGEDVSHVGWIPLVTLNLYVISFCIGFGPIPWFMMVELSTSKTKGWISSVGVSVNWAMVFLMTKVFTLMLTELGQAVTYGTLCMFCVMGTVFVSVCIPETKGKSRAEIQIILEGRK